MITNGIAVLTSFTAPVFQVASLAVMVYQSSKDALLDHVLGRLCLRDPRPR